MASKYLNPTQEANLKHAAALAVEEELRSGVPAELSTTQWALETGWGSGGVGNNLFGIKANTADKLAGTRVLAETPEFFNDKELAYFLSLGDGRVVIRKELLNGKPIIVDGRTKYRVKDWFKTFKNASESFAMHSILFTDPTRPYNKAFRTYQKTKNIKDLIDSLKIYSTTATYIRDVNVTMNSTDVKAAIASARIMRDREDLDD